MRITKVTTRTGDLGETGLGNGERLSKNSLRIHALGSVDKLNSYIGWTKVESTGKIEDILGEIQQDLFNIGGELAVPDVEMNLLTEQKSVWMENMIENFNDKLPALTEFILPGGNELSARLHLSRTQCRETERCIIGLKENEFVPDKHNRYLNRLSDLLFVFARTALIEDGLDEKSWDYE
tara:strand:- start:254 stop:793 length:540 start_codon:yes stop_codon:yes gene_type:complete